MKSLCRIGGENLKDQDTQQQFIKLRAEGLSYAKIANKLDISKGTCSLWEKKFADAIAKLKEERLSELYQSYGMLKDQRISSIGATLNQINNALDEVDLTSIDPAKLLELKLKYQEALKGEYIPLGGDANKLDSDSVLQEISNLIDRIKNGEFSVKEAGVELRALSTALGAYDKTVLEDKLDKLTEALEG